MGIKIGGLASGLPPNLVDQVIEAERAPIKQMETQKTKIDDKVKLVTDLETKVSAIKNNLAQIVGAKGFVDKKFNSSFPDIISGSLDPEVADAGEWSIEVLQLATKPSVVTTGFPDKDKTTMGVGYIKFDTEEGEKEVYIDEDNSTLEKMAAKINGAGIGIRATVVNDRSDHDDAYRLEIAGLKTGDDNEVKFPRVYFLDGQRDFNFVAERSAQNAIYKLDGHVFETASNVVTDLIPGVTLDLKRAAQGQPIRVNISENFEIIAGKLKSFVDSYNEALNFIHTQNKLTQDKTGNPRLGPLGGDSMLRMTESRLRTIIQSPQETDSKYKRILELGVEFTRTGTLSFNQDKFTKIVNGDPKAVVDFLRGDGFNTGFLTNMKNRISSIVDPQSGVVTTRKKSYQDRISQIDRRIEQKEKSLAKREETLRRQFSKMEESMSKIKSQGAAVSGGQ